MEQNKKTIQITPELFKISHEGKSKKTKSQTRKKPPAIRNNPLKRELMNKIKQHAKKHNKTLKNRENDDSTTFESHMDYLLNLSKKQKVKVNTELPNELQKVNGESESVLGGRSKITIKPLIEVPLSSIEPDVEPNVEPNTKADTNVEPNVEPNVKTDQNVEPIQSIPFVLPATQAPPAAAPAAAAPAAQAQAPTPAPAAQAQAPTPAPAQPSAAAVQTINIKKDPEYGILKKGKKPTYRQWHHNKTMRNRPQISKPKELIQEVKSTYKLGKSKKTRKVSIFLKNKKTRRKIQEEVNTLKKTPINDVKDYLRKHNIIKSGSSAPHDVLRQLYQQSHLAGEINNNSNENVIHNYLADSE
jgi:hypothetical protein